MSNEAGKDSKQEQDKDSSGSGLSAVMNFMPSAYYDLIARICPGMAFWVALSFKTTLLFGLNSEKLNELSGPVLFILIALSYVSGIVFTGFTVAWDWIALTCLSVTKLMRSHMGLDFPRPILFSSRWKLVSWRIDSVIKEDEGAGRVLVKAMAEVTLCQNLLSGVFVLACIGYYSSGERFFSPMDYMGFYIPIALALFVSMIFRQAMFLGRVKDLHDIYVSHKGLTSEWEVK